MIRPSLVAYGSGNWCFTNCFVLKPKQSGASCSSSRFLRYGGKANKIFLDGNNLWAVLTAGAKSVSPVTKTATSHLLVRKISMSFKAMATSVSFSSCFTNDLPHYGCGHLIVFFLKRLSSTMTPVSSRHLKKALWRFVIPGWEPSK